MEAIPAAAGCVYSQLLLYRTGVGTKIVSLVYKKSGISEYQTVYKTYCELFLLGTSNSRGPVCARIPV